MSHYFVKGEPGMDSIKRKKFKFEIYCENTEIMKNPTWQYVHYTCMTNGNISTSIHHRRVMIWYCRTGARVRSMDIVVAALGERASARGQVACWFDRGGAPLVGQAEPRHRSPLPWSDARRRRIRARSQTRRRPWYSTGAPLRRSRPGASVRYSIAGGRRSCLKISSRPTISLGAILEWTKKRQPDLRQLTCVLVRKLSFETWPENKIPTWCMTSMSSRTQNVHLTGA